LQVVPVPVLVLAETERVGPVQERAKIELEEEQARAQEELDHP
jgi:hypothetical protein